MGYIAIAIVTRARAVSWRNYRMTQTLRTLLPWRDQKEVYWECRRCGNTVDGTTDECPACGSAQIARYEMA